MSDELKPCKKCGGERRIYFDMTHPDQNTRPVTYCVYCRTGSEPLTIEQLIAELEALRSFKASVPWADLRVVLDAVGVEEYFLPNSADIDAKCDSVIRWLDANAPKEAHP